MKPRDTSSKHRQKFNISLANVTDLPSLEPTALFGKKWDLTLKLLAELKIAGP